MKLCMKHQRPKSFIFCSNHDSGLALTYFMARSNFATKVFIWENVTMMDSLEIIASCDLEFGYSLSFYLLENYSKYVDDLLALR